MADLDPEQFVRDPNRLDTFLERGYAPFAVFLAYWGLWFLIAYAYVFFNGWRTTLWLLVTLAFAGFLSGATTYVAYARHSQRVGPTPPRI